MISSKVEFSDMGDTEKELRAVRFDREMESHVGSLFPPNRMGGSHLSGSLVGSFTSKGIDDATGALTLKLIMDGAVGTDGELS